MKDIEEPKRDLWLSLALEGQKRSQNDLLFPRQITLLQRLGNKLKKEEEMAWQSTGVICCFKETADPTPLIFSPTYSTRGVSQQPPEFLLRAPGNLMSLGRCQPHGLAQLVM